MPSLKPKPIWHETYLIVRSRPQRTRNFPFDMLRYATCAPAREADTHSIEIGASIVLLRRFSKDGALDNRSGYGAARWESFGWEVVAHLRAYDLALDRVRALSAVGPGDVR